ncbi:peptide deformylase [Atopobacter sp. AH10]|uniref:peptide deformylase n=1 Tax=Atopobacter sp. AH10 TaxID=2315861 RepID=UPI000EF1DCFB|nr:peptide deformylase [Atopobacter sp. AH10]RLK63992.1 peptide deformylase [Atopobacter sp. AH10]
MITMDNIVREGNDVLRQRGKELTFPLSDDLLQLAEDMMIYLKNSQDEEIAKKYGLRAGVGLAAPQVGHSIRLIAVHVPEEDPKDSMSMLMVNPKILSESVQKIALPGEGCLSVDRECPGYVPRAKKITVRYQDLEGNSHKLKLSGYHAIVVQHEIDHINGILFYDRINEEDPFAKPNGLEIIQ